GGEVITGAGDTVTASYQGVLDSTNTPFGDGTGVALGAPPTPSAASSTPLQTASASGSPAALVYTPVTSTNLVGSATPFALTAVATFTFSNAQAGDYVNLGASTVAGPSPVASPSISTVPGDAVVIGSGAKLNDSATLTGGNNPTGTITFYLMG